MSMSTIGEARPEGAVRHAVTRHLGDLKVLTGGRPLKPSEQAPISWRLRNFLFHRSRALPALMLSRVLGRVFGILWVESSLRLRVLKADGRVIDYGLISRRVVTTTGVNFIVDAFQNLVEVELLKFHGIGTGAVAEAVGDTALGTELTTQYNPDNTRATGSTIEGAAANVYRTVGTNAVDAAVAITEHGILSQAAVPGGTLLDRSVFAAINLASGDSLQSTYDLTVSAGG